MSSAATAAAAAAAATASLSSAASAASTAAAAAAATTVGISSSPTMASAAQTTTAAIVKSPISTWGHPGGVFLSILQLIPTVLFWTITFLTITLPGYMFTFFSTGLTITMNATTLILILLVITSTVSWFVRYRFMDMYTMLPPEPQRKEPQVDLFPEMPDGDTKRGFSNYLDEFLSAIKVFGYLERPVFHELTRTVQTRKLIAGETLLLEEEKGFCLVVDGLVQIFVKSKSDASPNTSQHDDLDEDDSGNRGGQGYQLLTEVRNGAPLSSLFSILALFTEDVKLRGETGLHSRPGSSTLAHLSSQIGTPLHGQGSFTPASGGVDSPTEAGSPRTHRKRHQRGGSVVSVGDRTPAIPPLSLDNDGTVIQDHPQKHSDYFGNAFQRQKMFESAHPDIVARATVDTTIAVIPATAFRRLTRTYPKATSHIVQVILTRLQRVTLTTGHAYLGLTSEVLNTEKLMNKYTTYNLPNHLRGAALDRLKEKFSKEKDSSNAEERAKGIALHNPRAKRTRTLSSSLRKEATAARMAVARNDHHQQRRQSRPDSISKLSALSPEREPSGVNAGDLLTFASTTASARKGASGRSSFSQPFQTASSESSEDTQARQRAPSSFVSPSRSHLEAQRQESQDEDGYFRDSTVDCMLKAIGLSDDRGAIHRTESVPQSPHLVSYDSKKQRAFFTSAFGLIDALDIDGESESMVSVPASNASMTGGSGSIQEDLSSDVEIVYFPKDSVLVEQGERNPGLYYVIDGFLDVSVPEDGPNIDPTGRPTQKKDFVFEFAKPFMPAGTDESAIFDDEDPSHVRQRKEGSGRKSLYMIKPGGLAGYLGTITSRRSFANITAKTDVYVGFLSRASIERIVEKYPIVLLTMAKRLTSLLPRLILHIDFALGWEQVDAGQTIFKQGADSDAIYIVLNGRLRMLRQGVDGKASVIGEYGQGDSVGELEVLTESPRPGTLHAIRDTELAKIPKTLFNTLALENPEITIKISKIIATRMRDLTERSRQDHERRTAVNSVPSATTNLRTVCILPVTSGVPVTEFGSRLLNSLTQIGTPNGVTSLNQATILNHLGRHAFSRMGKLKLSQHLADLEEKFGLVLYIADTSVNSPWTQTCINQADCILLVGLAEGSPGIGEFERLLLTSKTTARKELVLLHAERYCPQGLTRQWLRNRMWINGSHHHIHMTFRNNAEPVHPQTRRFGSALKHRVQILQAEIQKYTSRRVRETPLYSAEQTPFKGDFHRLARRLVGKSVGLVLGGGGARGLAHIGIIRALEEAGVPIDIVGGTSIGAFVGALYAWDADMVPLFGRAKKFAGRMGSMWRFALDLTYPSASYTTGHEFNRGIFKTFGKAQMEDFWLEFYCNTTNISHYRPEIHTSGYVWRYVRASMSLAGLVPPLCDDGSLLVDGGYLDNLTVEHMRSLGASLVFAVDVGALDDNTPQAYGDSLSGFWASLNRWNPFSATPNPPTLSEVQARLAYVGSVDALERAKRAPGVRYLRPPVEMYGTLDFGRFDEIVEIGARFGREYLRDLFGREGGVLGAAGVLEQLSGEERKMRRTMAPRRASI